MISALIIFWSAVLAGILFLFTMFFKLVLSIFEKASFAYSRVSSIFKLGIGAIIISIIIIFFGVVFNMEGIFMKIFAFIVLGFIGLIVIGLGGNIGMILLGIMTFIGSFLLMLSNMLYSHCENGYLFFMNVLKKNVGTLTGSTGQDYDEPYGGIKVR